MTTILQWLGPSHLLTLWRVTTDPNNRAAEPDTICLGHIQDDGDTWSAWLAPGPTNADPHKLRTLDDREAAGRTLCARLRVEMPGLPGLTEGDGDVG